VTPAAWLIESQPVPELVDTDALKLTAAPVEETENRLHGGRYPASLIVEGQRTRTNCQGAW
jgi:hypothetical protein